MLGVMIATIGRLGSLSQIEHRREIDGLRAVAVVPVILFHAGVSQFSGGYVGVDIFFVISGYLITGILLKDLEEGRFCLKRFYERRARRILPALFLVILCCIPFAWFWMSPSQLLDFSRSLLAVNTFTSNILFWRESGYFEADTALKPLLHTWSLAVEEQFYLAFPLLLAGLWRWGVRTTITVLALLSLASIAAAHWGSVAKPSATFYLIFTRIWELGAGALCAIVLSGREPMRNTPLAALGLALIMASIFYFDQATPFPSLYALAPVGGTALIVLYGRRDTAVSRALAFRPIVWIGLISYSAYLWHQPLLAFAHLHSISQPSASLTAALVLLTFALAFLSWRFVERPFRVGPDALPFDRKAIFWFFGAGALTLSAIGLIGVAFDGAPSRKSPSGIEWARLDIDRRLGPNPGLSSECIEGHAFNAVVRDPRCRTGDQPIAALWGDSFAMHLAGILRAEPDAPAFIQLTRSQCAPVDNLARNGSAVTAHDCIAFNDRVLRYLNETPAIRYVIMSSPYDVLHGTVFDRENARMDGQREAPAAIIRTAETIRAMGKVPVFVTPAPIDGRNLGQCLASAAGKGVALARCDFPVSAIPPKRMATFELLHQMRTRYAVVDLRYNLCPNGRCMAGIGHTFLFRDNEHFSLEGSAYIGRNLRPFDHTFRR